jgi:hypothetical protein
MRAIVGLMGAVVGLKGAVVGSKESLCWLDGLILGAAGRLDGAESRAQERRWGRQ